MATAICMKLSCLYMYACVHTCMCACAWGTPPNTLTESYPHSPTPNPPNGGTPEISQKSIKIEQIKIFEFCLKILDL